MKKLLISALMLLATLSASAQMISAARDNQGVKFGVRGSFALSNMNREDDYSANFYGVAGASKSTKQLPAFAVGVAMDLPVLESFHFNIEMRYVMKGKKTIEKAKVSVLNMDLLNQENISIERIGYVEVPIQPQFRLNLTETSHLNVNVGPYIGLAVHGHKKSTFHMEGEDDVITKFYTFTGKNFTRVEGESRNWGDDDDKYKAPYSRLDVGMAMGIAYEIEQFHIGVSYDLGIKDIDVNARDNKDNSNYVPVKNRTALFTIGVNF